MIKIQVAYKNTSDEKELSFRILTGESLLGLIKVFTEAFPNAIIYSVLRCGKP